ncbi:MAG: hypothetical protein IPJ76_09095 [Flavobacteriales bacterium]|nr:MAG: hypothetical protein IPJ76_09095 [Flavobacteriales bacterium]
MFQTEFWTAQDGTLWMYGGRDTDAQEYAALWKYDPVGNTWTWIKGPNTYSFEGNFGTMGVPAPSNLPPAKSYCMMSWTDLDGNFWMYGGRNGSQFGNGVENNDLWRYEVATNNWTWMKGSQVDNPSAVWGVKGVPNSTNQPPALTLALTWTDDVGDLWMFGGYSTQFLGRYNAVWRYQISTNTWTWMAGEDTINPPANYGSMGVPAPTNAPSGRYAQSLGKSSDGKLWFYGGTTSGNFQYRDLWSFNTMTALFTWEGGAQGFPNSLQNGPDYGVLCTYSPLDSIGGRRGTTWRDSHDRLWLFGEATDGSNPYSRNDLWSYCTTSDQWTWVTGPSVTNDPGSWGTVGVSSPNNRPNGRLFAASWTGADGSLYVYGGLEAGSFFPTHNDLWRFVPDLTCAPCATTTAVEDVSASENLRIVRDQQGLGVLLPPGVWQVQVHDVIGRLLHTQQAQGQVYLQRLTTAAGLCIVSATDEKGNRRTAQVRIN